MSRRTAGAPLRGLFLAAAVAAAVACRDRSLADRVPEGTVREPAVAGTFYPAGADALRDVVTTCLREAVPARSPRPVALVAPHAGYLYSGQIAADAWRQAEGGEYDLVVLLGTNHTAPPFPGAAVSPDAGFRTPLGVAAVDREAAGALLAASPDCRADGLPHTREHSVEVQIPFVQVLFPRARILPLVVGSPDPEPCDRLGRALGKVLAGRRALVVASADLSHYPSAEDAATLDRKLLAAVASLDPSAVRAVVAEGMSRGIPGLSTCACGEAPILVALSAAKAMGARRGTVVSYANSGDLPVGDRRRVVGYGAVAFRDGPEGADPSAIDGAGPARGDGTLREADREALLALARRTIQRFLSTGTFPRPTGISPAAARPRGAFVTLKRGEELRGCTGRLLPEAPLDRTVSAMAFAAAFHDRRFRPVTLEELPRLSIEISVLTPVQRVGSPGEIRVGRDGVLLEKDGRQAVFLPQVATEQGWGRDEMLDQLCRKAGLPPGSWRDGARISVFQAEVFRERGGI